jgi:hypothetical protein
MRQRIRILLESLVRACQPPAGRADGQGVEVGAAAVLEDDGLGAGVAVAVAPILE